MFFSFSFLFLLYKYKAGKNTRKNIDIVRAGIIIHTAVCSHGKEKKTKYVLNTYVCKGRSANYEYTE